MTTARTWAESGLDYQLADGIAWLRLNRPEKRNAMDRPLRTALLEAIHEVSENPAARVGVITGEGTAFSSGADLTQEGGPIEIPPERQRGANTSRDDGILYGWYRLMESIWRSEKPFIASVNGMAAGGGCQLALACDLILAAESAAFWQVFVQRGLPLEGGAAWLLTRSISLARAKEMALFGDPIPAATAAEWGLINRCLPDDELAETTRDWAHRLANVGPPTGGPSMGSAEGPPPDLSPRVGHIKGQINNAWEKSLHQTFLDEVTLLGTAGFHRPEQSD